MTSPERILAQTFGFDAFRGQQRAIIDHVLEGGHALVLMPTGGGKSLCYQVPALARPDDLTVVISPLIALMKDQVDALAGREVDAAYINSSLTASERNRRYREVGEGRFRLLYVTPERFRKPDFVEMLAARQISLLAVDEAHCISQWGHDFRPDYTRLAEFRRIMNDPTTIALTATATPDVQRDIVAQLGLEPGDVRTFHEGIDRPNLELTVQDVWGEKEKLEAIEQVRRDVPGSGIVYFTLIRTLAGFSEQLRKRKIEHLCYHGELPREKRRRIQDLFMQGRDVLVLATNAFGMGIDKPDIRYVVHAEVPGSMESYYQEIGRAGRDGLPSRCALLYDQRDLATQMEFMRWSNPDRSFYARVHDMLLHDAEKVRSFGFEWLREKLNFKSRFDHRLETVLSMLDRHGVIEGTIDVEGDRIDVEAVTGLPPALTDEKLLAAKLDRDQRRLYALVEYFRCEGDRKAFIHEYFGLPYGA
ncbi:MAG: ATP-dependent DNA helicase [Phycisphaeraceae bacterium]|nr:ATP-dependent DNA helicase [Phycisphaeraceae bacterium]